MYPAQQICPKEPIYFTLEAHLGKVCNIIIDNCNTYNLISAKAVKKLGLPTETHPKPYTVGWIRSGDSVTICQSCGFAEYLFLLAEDIRIWCYVTV